MERWRECHRTPLWCSRALRSEACCALRPCGEPLAGSHEDPCRGGPGSAVVCGGRVTEAPWVSVRVACGRWPRGWWHTDMPGSGSWPRGFLCGVSRRGTQCWGCLRAVGTRTNGPPQPMVWGLSRLSSRVLGFGFRSCRFCHCLRIPPASSRPWGAICFVPRPGWRQGALLLWPQWQAGPVSQGAGVSCVPRSCLSLCLGGGLGPGLGALSWSPEAGVYTQGGGLFLPCWIKAFASNERRVGLVGGGLSSPAPHGGRALSAWATSSRVCPAGAVLRPLLHWRGSSLSGSQSLGGRAATAL